MNDLLNSKFYGIIFEDFDKLEWFVQNIKDSNTQQEIKNLLNKEAKGVYSSKNTSNRRYTIIESDGTPLGKVTASSELDAKVKFGIEHPEYADSQSISAKEIKSAREPGRFEIRRVEDYDYPCFYIYDTLKQKPLVYDLNGSRRLYYLSYTDAQDGLEEFENLPDSKELNAQYEQTTNTKEPYPNPSETPHDDIVLENHDGWVNTASEDESSFEVEQFWNPYKKRKVNKIPYAIRNVKTRDFLRDKNNLVKTFDTREEAVEHLNKIKTTK